MADLEEQEVLALEPSQEGLLPWGEGAFWEVGVASLEEEAYELVVGLSQVDPLFPPLTDAVGSLSLAGLEEAEEVLLPL